jgi:arabinofuranan 3-O-arabinosyltransferase
VDPATLSNAVPPRARRRLTLAVHAAAWVACLLVAAQRLATGRGRELYDRQAQWRVVRESFPVAAESPRAGTRAVRHDAEELMDSLMGSDAPESPVAAGAVTLRLCAANPLAAVTTATVGDGVLSPELVAAVNAPAVGGPLYPPTHGVLYAPLTLVNDPQAAYAAFQWLTLALTFVAGAAVVRISRGRIWLPVATLAVLLFPGYRSGIDLGQNQILTLNVLLWGWALLSRGRDGWAGFAWGLLAFKPVWAVAFLAVPLVMGRWRMLAAMCVTGGSAVLLTLPVVGVRTWFGWLEVGQMATATYNVNENWVTLSRDLAGIVRRATVDFTRPETERDSPLIRVACSATLVVVAAVTATVYRLRRNPGSVTGRAAGFLLLGAYLCCFHFMYYDTVLALVPLAALAADPRRLVGESYEVRRPSGRVTAWVAPNSAVLTAVALLLLAENVLMRLALEVGVRFGFRGIPAKVGGMPADAPRLVADTTAYSPNDTWILLALWAWLAVRLLTRGDDGEPQLRRAPAEKGVECGPDVVGPHQ